MVVSQLTLVKSQMCLRSILLVLDTDISAQIQALPLYKSCGMFSCPVKILKRCKHIISLKPLAYIYNLSVIQAKYPSKLKLAKIVPVYKNDDESCHASNYRPISLYLIIGN